MVKWNAAVLDGVRRSKLGPPQVSRALAIVHTCIYDAWAAYDNKALGTRLGADLRRPANERGSVNKNKAISFAAYRAAKDVMPAGGPVYDAIMARLGYDPMELTTDTTKPAGVGNIACKAVLDFRHHDGSNQLGDMNGGAPYSDYTGYTPANAPMNTDGPIDAPMTVADPNRWQPLTFKDASGTTVTPPYIAPHWTNVVPFALTSGSQFRSPTGPALYGSQLFDDQARDLLEISANLTDTHKLIAEYWADGPKSELPPGHWNLFAQFVSRRDHHVLNQDVQLFFALTNAIFDAGIVAWDNKDRIQLGAPHHRPAVPVQRPTGQCVGRPRPGHPDDRRRHLVPLPGHHLPHPAVRRVLLGSQQLQRRRSGDPQALHRQ